MRTEPSRQVTATACSYINSTGQRTSVVPVCWSTVPGFVWCLVTNDALVHLHRDSLEFPDRKSSTENVNDVSEGQKSGQLKQL